VAEVDYVNKMSMVNRYEEIVTVDPCTCLGPPVQP